MLSIIACLLVEPVPVSLDRTAMYEALYSRHGYHANLNTSHARDIIMRQLIPAYSKRKLRYAKVLDVGCSHGNGVALLWSRGFCASGIDLSPTAVSMATAHRHPPQAIVDNCKFVIPFFQKASAADLPFGDWYFNAILSTDVLEHMPEALVATVVAEFTRVASDDLFLKIAAMPEGNRQVHKLDADVKQADNLHETIRGTDWWTSQFEAARQWKCQVPATFELKHSPSIPGENIGTDHLGHYISWFWLVCKRVSSRV